MDKNLTDLILQMIIWFLDPSLPICILQNLVFSILVIETV